MDARSVLFLSSMISDQEQTVNHVKDFRDPIFQNDGYCQQQGKFYKT